MRLEWLEDILAVAETGSFSDAAERRLLTQSAFSRRIQSIEDHVGVELFDRTRKPVQLHPTTAEQRDRIAQLSGALRQLTLDLRQGAKSLGNRIVIASQHALTTALTPGLIQDIHAQNPDIHVRLRSANLDECFAQLLSRQADIALVYRMQGQDHPIEADYIETMALGTDRLIPVLETGAAAALDPGGVLPVIAYPPEVFLGQAMTKVILAQLRGTVQVSARAETALTLAALELAAVGIGVAWVPASLARARIAAGALADLSDRLPVCVLSVTAVRLAGVTGTAQSAVWAQLGSRAFTLA